MKDDPSTEVHGLKGEYFAMSAPGARDFAELGATALDPDINFPGLTGAFESADRAGPSTPPPAGRGRSTAPETGDYTFSAIGDNGFRLFIDDKAGHRPLGAGLGQGADQRAGRPEGR